MVKSGDSFAISSVASHPLPPETIVDKVIRNEEALAQAIKSVFELSGTNAKLAAIAVPDSSVITKVIQLEAGLSDSDIENQIMLEAEKYIPYPLEEVRTDFCVLGPSATQEDVVDVLLVACRSESVDTRVQAIEAAGYGVKVVDVESYAAERASNLVFAAAGFDPTDKIIAIFDVGAELTNLTVVFNNLTVYTREESFGGHQLLQEIQDRYEISRDEAVVKLNSDTSEEFRTETLEPFVENTLLYMRRTLQMFYSSSQHEKVDAVVISGGVANLPNLSEKVQQQVGAPTLLANPLVGMTNQSRKKILTSAK